MDIKQMQSALKMRDFYFSECIVERELAISDGEYEANIEKEITQVAEHEYAVRLVLTIRNDCLRIKVTANAVFLYDSSDYEKEEKIIKSNTVAIMFPFIRSQVSLLTTQPGMSPIVLPPINTAKFE